MPITTTFKSKAKKNCNIDTKYRRWTSILTSTLSITKSYLLFNGNASHNKN